MPRARPLTSRHWRARIGAEQLPDMGLAPEVEAGLHRIARRAGELFVGDDAHARLEHLSPGESRAICWPSQRMTPLEARTNALGSLRDLSRRGSGVARRAPSAPRDQSPWRPNRPRSPPSELEAIQRPTAWPSMITSPVLPIALPMRRVLSQPAREDARAPVDKTLRQPLCRRPTACLRRHARPLASVRGCRASPAGWRRRSSAHMGDAVRQRIDSPSSGPNGPI